MPNARRGRFNFRLPGDVAKALAAGFAANGHGVVMLGTRTAAKPAEWARQNSTVQIGSFANSAKFGEVIALAVKGTAAQAAYAPQMR